MAEFRIDVVIDPRTATGTRRVEGDLKRIENRGNAVRSVLTRMLTLLGGGALITKSIRTLAQFEQTMSTVASVTGATGAEFDALTQKAKDLGISTRFTATQAAEGLVELARAGLTTTESLEAVGDTLVLAQAGELGLAQAAGITTTALKVFNLEASDTVRVADDLVIVANSTKTNVTEMGQAFTFVAANAADLNLSIEETTALLGALANGGLTATRGGTALRAVLLGLAAPTEAANDAFEAAGLSLADVDINARGIVPVLETLAAAELDVEQKTAIFGKRFGAAASILLKNIPLVQELVEKQALLAGEAQRVADIMDDNLNGALLRMKSAFEGLILEIGSGGATGAFRSFFESLANGLRTLAANADKVIDTLEFLIILLGVKFARFAIGAAISGLKALGIAFLTNPIGLFVTALTLGIAALVAFGDDLKLVSGEAATFGDFMAEAAIVAQNAFEGLAIFLGDVFAPIFAALGADANSGIKGMLEAVAFGLDAVAGLFRATFNAIKTVFNFKNLGEALLGGVIEAANIFLRTIEKALDSFGATVLGTFKGIGEFIGAQFDIIALKAELAIAKVKLVTTEASNPEFGNFVSDLEANLIGAERTLGAGLGDTIIKNINSTFRELQAGDVLGQIENPFIEATTQLGVSTADAFNASFATQAEQGAGALLNDIFDRLDQRVADREAAAAAAAAEEAAAGGAGTGSDAARERAAGIDAETKALVKRTTAFDAYIGELEREKSLLGLSSRQREIANEILAVENQLREEGLELTGAQRERLTLELEELQLLQVKADLLDEIRGPQEEQALQQQALNLLFQDGTISIDQYNQALRNLATQATQTSGVLGSTVQPGLETIGQQLFGIGEFTKQTLGAVFSNLEDALVSFAQTGEFSFSKLVDSMLQDIARLLVQQGLQLLLGLLTGGAGGAVGGILSAVTGGGGGGGGVLGAITGGGGGGGGGIIGGGGGGSILSGGGGITCGPSG